MVSMCQVFSGPSCCTTLYFRDDVACHQAEGWSPQRHLVEHKDPKHEMLNPHPGFFHALTTQPMRNLDDLGGQSRLGRSHRDTFQCFSKDRITHSISLPSHLDHHLSMLPLNGLAGARAE